MLLSITHANQAIFWRLVWPMRTINGQLAEDQKVKSVLQIIGKLLGGQSTGNRLSEAVRIGTVARNTTPTPSACPLAHGSLSIL